MTTMNVNMPASNDLFGRAIAAVRNWVQRNQTRAALERLSERELSDIGLCRADIDRVVSEHG